jgi:DNA gyrase subunit A
MPSDHLMMVTNRGNLIRMRADHIRLAGRRTQGVTLVRMDEGEWVVSVSRLPQIAKDEGILEELGEVVGES